MRPRFPPPGRRRAAPPRADHVTGGVMSEPNGPRLRELFFAAIIAAASAGLIHVFFFTH